MEKITMQQLKQQRLTPAEKFVLNKIKGAKPSEPDEDGNIAWYKDSKWLFEQGFIGDYLWVTGGVIWLVLEKEYCLNYNEIQQLLSKLLYKYTNNGQLKVL